MQNIPLPPNHIVHYSASRPKSGHGIQAPQRGHSIGTRLTFPAELLQGLIRAAMWMSKSLLKACSGCRHDSPSISLFQLYLRYDLKSYLFKVYDNTSYTGKAYMSKQRSFWLQKIKIAFHNPHFQKLSKSPLQAQVLKLFT